MRQELVSYETLSEKIDSHLEADTDRFLKIFQKAAEKGERSGLHLPLSIMILVYTTGRLDRVSTAYTRGDTLDDINAKLVAPSLARLMTTYSEMEKMDLIGKEYLWGVYSTDGDSYEYKLFTDHVLNVLVLLAYFECFNVDKTTRDRIIPIIAPLGKNELVDRVLAMHGVQTDATPSYQPYNAVCKKLLTIMDAEEEKRPELVCKYLEGWAKILSTSRVEGNILSLGHSIEMSHRTNNTLHKDIAGKYPNYKGHWAWEVVYLVKTLGIDDTSFRQHDLYPVEMVDYKAN